MKTIWLLLAALVISVSVQATEINIEPIPSWVSHQPLDMKIERKDRVNGKVYLLVSNQLNYALSKPEFYTRYVTKAVNVEGVESISQITIDFDPSYQEVVFHSLNILRDGESFDRLKESDVKRFKREDSLEKLLYSGQETYYLVVNNVQEGDIIDYSYSIRGVNPVFKGKVDYWVKMGWSVPVMKTYARILTPEGSGISVDRFGETDHLNAKISQKKGIVEYIFSDSRRSYNHLDEPDQPSWFYEYPYLNINNYADWQQVVSWALPYYQFKLEGEKLNQELVKLKSIGDPEEQIVAAIKFVQHSIRYLGIENGIGSHAPREPEQTLLQGYGDCKDKSVLLTALLRGLGIEANPALVSTVYRKHLVEQLSGHSAFNHVIVTFEFGGDTYWIDPTQTDLSDNLATMTQSELGYGLVIRDGEIWPTSIETDNENEVKTTSTFDVASLDDGSATLAVETTYIGKQADQMRRYLNSNSMEQVMDEFEAFYNKHYDGVVASETFNYSDDRVKNELHMMEYYEIEKMWFQNEENVPQFEVYADVIGGNIYASELKRRNTPFYIGRPLKIAQTMVLALPYDWQIKPVTEKIANDAFSFSLELTGEEGSWLSSISQQYRQARVKYQLERNKQDIFPEALQDYNKQLDKASESVVYQFTYYED